MNTRLDEFFKVAHEMRALQRRFFSGDKTVVGRAKAAERRFDALLQELRPKEREEATLFNEPMP
jgi:hypothetical protein